MLDFLETCLTAVGMEETDVQDAEDTPALVDARARYFKDLSSVIILNPTEEREVYTRYANSNFTDVDARDLLIRSCLRLVVTRASKYARNNASMLDDLISAGNEGLLEALKRYDPNRGTRIPSYSIWWIDLRIREALSGSHPVKVPIWRQKKGAKLRRLRSQGLSTTAMAEECDLTEVSAKELESDQYQAVDITTINFAENMEYVRSITDITLFENQDIEEDSVSASASRVLNKVLSELPEDDQVIIRGYYGIGRDPLNLPQLAETRGVTSERVRQIKTKVLDRLRVLLRQQGINSLEDIL